ncbi:phospholipase D family protein [Defluviimonas sp. WL0075]|uniref:Phospholipase D n=1 Tax=Albidovulum sediminicola TaxID=2984331 RepID=A0ABT2Z4U2_9RHOB|nr:phospholipase D family protein [Defluviimonas sp. WL0075]MCV2866172.1 phospholipase D family protein [Defluviimonas sp. WL0075]
MRPRPGRLVRALRNLAAFGALVVSAVLGLRAFYALPSLDARTVSAAIPASAETTLGAAILPDAARHPGLSGVFALENGIDAFAARMSLALAAEHSIDAQYYIWQDDLTGLRLLSELSAAATRGVRVRLLVDDNGTPALDQELLALSALPSAEVRIFNPFVLRAPRGLNYMFDFSRLNRRMHNKSFTVDGVVTIVGGRNIGNLYFETGSGHLYSDLDVMAFGPAAADVGADFDRYWNSHSAYPVELLVKPEPGGGTRLAARDAALRETAQAELYGQAVRSSRLSALIRDRSLPIEWTRVRLFSDDPAKALGQVNGEALMFSLLMAEIERPAHSFDSVSAYFVPGRQATRMLAGMAQRGIKLRTLTNALESTDVAPVHSGYIGYRDALVDAGVEVWELKSEGGERKSVDDFGIIGISRTALHAKTFQIDGRRAFVGSFNFDPRSKRLNCEMGLMIDSPALAGLISGWLDRELPRLAYRVLRDASGGLVWIDRSGAGEETVWTHEPNTTWPLRTAVWMIGFLPVEWLL